MSKVRPVDLSEGSQSIFKFIILEKIISIWNFSQLKQLSILLT